MATRTTTKAKPKPKPKAVARTRGKVAAKQKVVTPSNEEIRTAQVLGVSELCEFLGVERSTVHVWGYRKQLPPPDYDSVNGFRAWRRLTIVKWAAQTGRLPDWLKPEGAKFEPPGGYKRKRRTKAEIAAAQ